jgi:Tfp pilus assembly protein PilV
MRQPTIPRDEEQTLLARLRSEGGFGLIELLVAMVVMMIAVMALVAALTSSHVSVVRASRISTAAAIASAELEKFRALKYADTAFDVDATCASGLLCRVTTDPNRVGADGRTYPTTTTVAHRCDGDTVPTGTAPALTCPVGVDGRPFKTVTVVVRDLTTARVLVSESSVFDEATAS